MEKLLSENHGFEAFAILLVLNVLGMVGKFLYRLFDKKNDQTEKNLKAINEKTQQLSEQLSGLRGSTERLQSLISSYMETTIGFASKLGSVEKQLINSAENLMDLENQISQIPRYDDDMKKFMQAIKWLAGPERWSEIKETILKDDFPT
jgi:septal ring factor EnvC (AmiA/AmiB activator)